MDARKSVVRSERLLVDETLDGPVGALLDRGVAEPVDELDDAERAELHAAIDEGLVEMRAGGGADADDLLAVLRRRG